MAPLPNLAKFNRWVPPHVPRRNSTPQQSLNAPIPRPLYNRIVPAEPRRVMSTPGAEAARGYIEDRPPEIGNHGGDIASNAWMHRPYKHSEYGRR